MQNYEQKYKEALERAKSYYNDKNCMKHIKSILEYTFPELKESEDEEIRQAMINFFKSERIKDGIAVLHFGVNIEKMIAWLEKRCEPKWSEEDSSMQLTLMRNIEQISFISKEGKDERIMWLNKLDERLGKESNK